MASNHPCQTPFSHCPFPLSSSVWFPQRCSRRRLSHRSTRSECYWDHYDVSYISWADARTPPWVHYSYCKPAYQWCRVRMSGPTNDPNWSHRRRFFNSGQRLIIVSCVPSFCRHILWSIDELAFELDLQTCSMEKIKNFLHPSILLLCPFHKTNDACNPYCDAYEAQNHAVHSRWICSKSGLLWQCASVPCRHQKTQIAFLVWFPFYLFS